MRFLYPILILGWTLGSIWFWHQKHKACHEPQQAKAEEKIASSSYGFQSTAPISFYKSTFLPDTLQSFVNFKDSILSEIAEGQVLRITTPYEQDETNESGEDNLGIARSNAVAKLFEPELTPDRIQTSGFESKIDGDIVPKFQIFNRSELMPESENRFIIYFAPGSYKMLNAEVVKKRLDEISRRVRASGEKIIITAYTDNIEASDGPKLSKSRAWIARKGFEDNYVRRKLVEYNWKGTQSPVASNKTEEGRALNRRVEIEIMKK